MVNYTCCVKGCNVKGVISHRFPNPRLYPDRMNEWMKIIGLENDNPITVYAKKRVCGIHFTDDCSTPGTKRLHCKANPTIHLPAVTVVTSPRQHLDTSTSENPAKLTTDLEDFDLSGINILDTSSELLQPLSPNYKKMSEQNSIFILEDSTLVKEETVLCPDYHLIKMEGITTYQNDNHNNKLYHIEDITLESSNINAINVHENKKEIPDSNTGIQNTILNLEDDLVKEEMYTKEEILSDDDNNKIYHTENVWVDNNKSDNITINTFNVYKQIKTENNCINYSIQNSKFYLEDGYSVKNENVSSMNDENTTSKNNYDDNLSYNYEKKKVESWTIVENEYNRNSLETVYRSALAKKRVQKKIADEKAGVKGTGGEPCLKLNLDSSDTTVCEILSDKRLGLQCSKHDDNENVQDQYFSKPSTSTSSDVFMVPVEQGLVEEILEVNSDIFGDTGLSQEHTKCNEDILNLMRDESFPQKNDDPVLVQETNTGHKWSGNITPLLCTKRKQCLIQDDEKPISPLKKRQRLNDQMSSWASGKVVLVQLQKKAFIEQSQIKFKLMKEENAAKMAREEKLARMQKKVKLLKEK